MPTITSSLGKSDRRSPTFHTSGSSAIYIGFHRVSGTAAIRASRPNSTRYKFRSRNLNKLLLLIIIKENLLISLNINQNEK